MEWCVEHSDREGRIGMSDGESYRKNQMHRRQHTTGVIAQHKGRDIVRFEYAARDRRFDFADKLPDDHHRVCHVANISPRSDNDEGAG